MRVGHSPSVGRVAPAGPGLREPATSGTHGKLGAAVADPGNPFTPAAKSVASDGTASDGPVGTMATGYTVAESDSLDAATEMAKGGPVLQGGASISVFEAFEVM
jgi:hypothetical protein